MFQVGGLAGVKQAFADFDKLLARLDRMEGTHAQAGAQARVRAEQGANAAIGRVHRQSEREAERASRMALKLAEKEAREKQRLAERTAREQTKEAARSAREQEREAAALARYRENVVRNSLRAEQTMRSQMERAVTSSLVAERRKQERWAHSVGGVVGGGVSRGIGTVGRLAGIAGGLMGGFSVAAAMDQGMREEAMAGEIIRGSTKTGSMTRGDVSGKARAAGIEVGADPIDVLAGVGAFTRKTGNLTAIMRDFDDLIKLSVATGASMEDMGSTAAEVFSQLNETGQGNETMDVMRTLAGMGREGAIDIKDLGQYGGRISASAAMFEGDLAGNIKTLGAVAQLSRRLGGGDVAESTMAVQHLGADVSREAAREHLDKYKINVWADKGHTTLRDPEKIITEAVSKTKGNLTALEQIFGERAIKAVKGAQRAYVRAGGGAAGEEEIRRLFTELRTAAISREDVDKNVADSMTEPGRRMQRAVNEMTDTLTRDLLPLMPKFTDAARALIPALSRVTEWLANNANWSGVGTIVGGAIALDIMKAGVGAMAGKALEKALGGIASLVRPPAPPTPPGQTPTPPVGSPNPVRSLSLSPALRALPGVALAAEGAEKAQAMIGSSYDAKAIELVRGATEVARGGGLEAARAEMAKIEAARLSAREAQAGAGLVGDVRRLGTDLFGAGGAQAAQEQGKAFIRNMTAINEAAEALETRLKSLGAATEDTTEAMGPWRLNDGIADPNHPARRPLEMGR
jgi:hypothetical protein